MKIQYKNNLKEVTVCDLTFVYDEKHLHREWGITSGATNINIYNKYGHRIGSLKCSMTPIKEHGIRRARNSRRYLYAFDMNIDKSYNKSSYLAEIALVLRLECNTVQYSMSVKEDETEWLKVPHTKLTKHGCKNTYIFINNITENEILKLKK